MKHLITAIFIAIIFTAIAIGENPDSRPSITFAVGKTFGSGENTVGIKLPDIMKQEADISGLSFSTLLKFPATDGFTVSLVGGYSYAKTGWDENLSFYESEIEFSTYSIGFAATFYFGSSVNK